MSLAADRTLTLARPLASSPYCVWVPLMGGLWVVINVALVYLGLHVTYSLPCSMLAGTLNGILLSVVAVAKASERFKASVTGLLSGLSLTGLRSDGSALLKATQAFHAFVDQALLSFGIEGTEQLHHQIEQQALYIVWTTVFVVLASLIAEWVLASRAESSQ